MSDDLRELAKRVTYEGAVPGHINIDKLAGAAVAALDAAEKRAEHNGKQMQDLLQLLSEADSRTLAANARIAERTAELEALVLANEGQLVDAPALAVEERTKREAAERALELLESKWRVVWRLLIKSPDNSTMDKPLSGWPSRVLDEYGRDLRDAVRSIAGASSELRSKAERALADALAAKDTAEAQVAVLVRALMPFAKFIVGVSAKDEAPAAYGVFHSNETPLTVRDFRLAQKAVAAYKASREGKEGE